MLQEETTWLELAKTQMQMGLYQEAVDSLVKSNQAKENYTACFLLGNILGKYGKLNEALDYYHRAVNFKIADAVLYKNLGIVYENLPDINKAIEAYWISYQIDPNPEMRAKVRNLVLAHEHNLKALTLLEEEIQHTPDNAGLLMAYGDALQKIGNSHEGAEYYKKGLRMKPFKDGYSHLLYIMHHDSHATNADFKEIAEECYKNCLEPIKSLAKTHYDFSDRALNPNKKIRVAYISKRLRAGLADYWALAVLKEIDKTKFELVFYQDSLVEDSGTQEFKDLADEWKITDGMNHQELADLVYQDRIDIFVDLVGHIGGGRLEVFTLKPAPIQVCWINYYGTLAMPEMDYFIADANIVTEETEKYFVEKVYKMPDIFNPFTPKMMDVTITDTIPYKKNGYITFGSLNRFNKINMEVLELWAEVLKQVENSVFYFSAPVFKESQMNDLIKNFFVERGISQERIITDDFPALKEFFEKFNEIDVLLDPFPFTGGATSIDSVFMGVPTITLNGETWVHRSGYVTMRAIGCEELIANSKEEYLKKYIELANDITRLENYRKELRGKLLNSAICDNKLYGQNMQKAYECMWEQFCQEQKINYII